jgi:hypothetical protein
MREVAEKIFLKAGDNFCHSASKFLFFPKVSVAFPQDIAVKVIVISINTYE